MTAKKKRSLLEKLLGVELVQMIEYFPAREVFFAERWIVSCQWAIFRALYKLPEIELVHRYSSPTEDGFVEEVQKVMPHLMGLGYGTGHYKSKKEEEELSLSFLMEDFLDPRKEFEVRGRGIHDSNAVSEFDLYLAVKDGYNSLRYYPVKYPLPELECRYKALEKLCILGEDVLRNSGRLDDRELFELDEVKKVKGRI